MMGVRITGMRDSEVALYDSTTGIAFGPVFSTTEEAEAFLAHLEMIGERDPRVIPLGDLVTLAAEWKAER